MKAPLRARLGAHLPIFAVLTGVCVWGLTWWPIQAMYGHGMSALVLGVLAYGAAFAVLLPRVARRQLWCRRYWQTLLLVGLLGGYANCAFTAAMAHGEASRVMLLFYLEPAWAILGGWLILKERITARRQAGLVLALAGAGLVLSRPAGMAAPTGHAAAWIDLLSVTAGLAYALNNIVFRATVAMPMAGKNAAMFLGCVVMCVLALASGIEPVAVGGPSVLVGALAFGVLGVLLASLCTQYGVSQLPASRAGLLLVVELPVTVISAACIAGARLTAMELAGGAMVLLAALLEGAAVVD